MHLPASKNEIRDYSLSCIHNWLILTALEIKNKINGFATLYRDELITCHHTLCPPVVLTLFDRWQSNERQDKKYQTNYMVLYDLTPSLLNAVDPKNGGKS